MDTVRKTATTVGGGVDFILSDETVDRFGDVVTASGWDLRTFRRNPIALFGHDSSFPIGTWKDVRVEGKRLLGRLELAAAGTSARIDELRALVEQKILRAVSVGFRVLEAPTPIEPRGMRYSKHELLETSLVAVPANPAALARARSLGISDETLTMAFGEHAATRSIAGGTASGAHAATSLPKVKTMSTLTSRIETAAQELNAARDQLTEVIGSEHADEIVIDELSTTIEAREKTLAALKRAEKTLAASTVMPVGTAGGEVAAPAIRRPLGVQTKEPAPGDLIIRAALCQVVSHVTGKPVEKILEDRYGDHEATQIVTRAAIAGATTTTSGWAAELVQTANADFMSSLRAVAVFPQLAALGQSLSFGPGSGAIKIPSRAATPSIAGSFVAEGAAIPVRRIGLTSITLNPHKLGVISVFTREMARYSTPAIEGLLREEIRADTALTIDSILLDATGPATAIRPAGLKYLVTPITASALNPGYAAIIADINALLTPFDTANSSGRIALIMNPAQARLLSMTPGPDGTFGWADKFVAQFSVIVSTTVTAGNVIAVGASDFVAVAGTPEFDVSEQTVLHMEDTTPLNIGTVGSPATVAAPAQSMFQTASVALRMLLPTTWAMRRSGMVQSITTVDWT